MIYIFDTNSLSVLFKNFYPDRFPTLWDKFDDLKSEGSIISTKEVFNEIISIGKRLTIWAEHNRDFFENPSPEELEFVKEIFQVNHFHSIVRKQNHLRGTPVADPFVIAKAKIDEGYVITEEVIKPNAAKIPNICQHFNIPCTN